jgi:hypothetical protein
MKRFSVHFNAHTPIQIVFLNNMKTVGPLSKTKPFTRRGPKIGKKKHFRVVMSKLLTIK